MRFYKWIPVLPLNFGKKDFAADLRLLICFWKDGFKVNISVVIAQAFETKYDKI